MPFALNKSELASPCAWEAPSLHLIKLETLGRIMMLPYALPCSQPLRSLVPLAIGQFAHMPQLEQPQEP